jgi:hypothetical protein
MEARAVWAVPVEVALQDRPLQNAKTRVAGPIQNIQPVEALAAMVAAAGPALEAPVVTVAPLSASPWWAHRQSRLMTTESMQAKAEPKEVEVWVANTA